MYAVTFALLDESRDFRRLLLAPSHRNGLEFGTLHGAEVAVGHIGVGKAAAEEGIRNVLREVRPQLVLCAGYGGALDPALRIGDLVLDLQYAGPVQPRAAFRVGKIHTAAEAAESIEAKRALHSVTGAHVVDMETAIVAAACAEAGIPMLAIRVISDEASQPLPVPIAHWFDLAAQRPRALALVRYLALHPRAIAPFARFVSGLSGARARLAAALSDVIGELAQPQPD